MDTHTHIDKIITEANLRDVKVFDFDQELEQMSEDLDTTSELLRKQGIWEDSIKGYKKRETEIANLRQQSRDWIHAVGFKNQSKQYRMVVLIEEIKT